MAGPVPVLHNGMGARQGIYGASDTRHHQIGTRASLSDGRVFYYSRSSGAALVAGELIQSEAASADLDDQVTDTHAIGDTVIGLTSVNTYTADANDFAGGYFHQQLAAATGGGIAYRIASSSAITAAAAYTVTLKDPLVVALGGTAKGTIAKSPWMDTVIMGANGTDLCVGVPQTATLSGATTKRYFWAQTWGVACVSADSASNVGDALMRATGTAGETLIAVAGDQVIGVAYTLGVDGAFAQCFLQIAP